MSADSAVPTPSNPMRAVMQVRDFMLLWIGQATSMLGDQFHGIASAWLVLKLTGDPLALGTVMALGGIPRAIFTVIGGAVTDRLSPRMVMLFSDVIRLCLSALIAIQLFTGTLEVWMIYLYALIGGIVGGFFGPASMSIVPHILPEDKLQAGNSLTQGSAQLIGIVGPAVAGAMIAAFADQTAGVSLAIAFDALTFIASIVTLWLMRTGGKVTASGPMNGGQVWSSIREGFAYILRDPMLGLIFVIIAVANLSFSGPIMVGVPYLADTRFPEGAAAYGVIISGYAGGNLLGIILAGVLPKFKKEVMQILLAALMFVFAFGITALRWIPVTWLAAVDLFTMGLLNGYMSILLITSLQRKTPKDMLGRLMSMILLANMGLMPLSQAIGGAMLKWNLAALYIGAGGLLLVLGFALLPRKTGGALSAYVSE